MPAPELRRWITGSLRESTWAPALVRLFLATAARRFAADLSDPWLDIPTHFIGGLASADDLDVCIARLRPRLGPDHARLALCARLVTVAAIVRALPEYRLPGSHRNLGVNGARSDLLRGRERASCVVAAQLARGRPRPAAADV